MNYNKTGGAAFPAAEVWDRDLQCVAHKQTQGMTLRDYFAAKAMNAVLANNGGAVQANSACGWSLCNCTFSDVAEFSYQVADAMLSERDKQRQEGM